MTFQRRPDVYRCDLTVEAKGGAAAAAAAATAVAAPAPAGGGAAAAVAAVATPARHGDGAASDSSRAGAGAGAVVKRAASRGESLQSGSQSPAAQRLVGAKAPLSTPQRAGAAAAGDGAAGTPDKRQRV